MSFDAYETRTAPRSAVADGPTPAMVLHRQALHNNVDVMSRFCGVHGVDLAPHAKTSMAPYVIRAQVARGVWGMTAASVEQARHLVGLGVRRILIANEVVDAHDLTWLSAHLDTIQPSDDLLCFVDSAAGVEHLERHLGRRAHKLGVLVELGYHGGRTGVRSVGAGSDLARRVARSHSLQLRGVAGYEGLMRREGSATPPGLGVYLQATRSLLLRCVEDGLFSRTPIATAGGSSYFDAVVDHLGPRLFDFELRTILRSGCYATHDHGIYQDTSPLDGRGSGSARLLPALELIATVVSRPEPDLAILNFGRRHVPTDDRLPIPLWAFLPDGSRSELSGAVVHRVDDQHAYLVIDKGSPLSLGDRVGFGISHPCGAFDRWRQVSVVDDRYRIVDVATPLL